ncbi:MAG: ribokinase [Gammaproteobacteria bacterium]
MKNDRNNQVVVVGSTNVDLIMQVSELPAPGETVGDAVFTQALGGKGANQAMAAARSGADVSFVSVVGDDDFGRRARDAFTQEGMDLSALKNSAESTGTALIFVDQHGENCIGVAPGANARCDVQHVAESQSTIHQAAVVLMQLEIPFDAVQAVLDNQYNAHFILNAAPAVQIEPEDLRKLDTLVVNQTELFQVLALQDKKGRQTEMAAACNALHDMGVTNVVVTLGRQGVFLSLPNTQQSLPGFNVKTVDTTGAGDTFCGALAAQLAGGHRFIEAVTFAQASAAIACTGLGAQTAVPYAASVNRFLTTGSI